jgi:quercetin dioxygenase-like cupin family protein
VRTLKHVPRARVEPQEPVKGVKRWVLAYGDKVMLVYFEIDEGARFPMHSHVHEQAGYIIKGRMVFKTPNKEVTVSEGESYVFESNEPHEVYNPGPGKTIIVEVFSPPREDFLK